MPAKKKQTSYVEDFVDSVEKKGKKGAKKAVKKLHTATKIIVALVLVLGIAAGFAASMLLFKNDNFTLKGKTKFSMNVGDEPLCYTEEGVEAVCFGRDVSGTLKVEPSDGIICNDDGTYTIPTDKEGVYTLTYTVDCYKFGEDREGGPIKRIRVFTVDAVEEDGKGTVEEGENSGT